MNTVPSTTSRPLSVAAPRAQLLADADLRHVGHAQRHALRVAEDHVADVLGRLHLARRADQVLFAALLDVARAHVGVVAVERGHDVGHREAVREQLGGIGRDLELLGIAADGVDLGHARHVAQLRLDDPVLDLAQVGRRVGLAVGPLRALFRLHGPEVDLAQAGGDRPHHRRDPLGHLLARRLDALVDELAREVDVGAVLEDHGHLRQPVARQRARLLQARQAGHHGLDRVGHALLGLQRRVAGRGGVDLHLHVGDVGHRVDGQLLVAEHAERGHAQHREQHQPALLDGESDHTFEHRASSVGVGRRGLACCDLTTKLPAAA
jgi:hypothetical protein